jgi:hypothetical protein
MQKKQTNSHLFLKFGNAVKDPKLAFAFTVLWKNNINSTVRRIYSGHSDYFSTGLIFREKTEKKKFLANQKLLGDSG